MVYLCDLDSCYNNQGFRDGVVESQINLDYEVWKQVD